MHFIRNLVMVALAGLTLACGTAEDAPTERPTQDLVRALDQSFDFVDGAGEARSVQFIAAALLEDGVRLRYRAVVDGQPLTIDYAQYGSNAPMELTVTGPDATASLALIIEAGGAEFFIAGEPVGVFEWTEEGTEITTARASDPLSFALLSLFPHQVAGLEPAGLFEYERAGDAPEGYGALQQGKVTLAGILGGIGKIFGGGARVRCNKVKIYTCDTQCAQTADGCACGGACGPIACCSSGCTIREERTYEGGVGTGG